MAIPKSNKSQEIIDQQVVEQIEKAIDIALEVQMKSPFFIDGHLPGHLPIDIDIKIWSVDNGVMLELVKRYAQAGWFIAFSKRTFNTVHVHLN